MKKASNIIYLDSFSEDSYGYYHTLLMSLEEVLQQQLESFSLVKPLSQAVDYAMFPAGKRIRPLLACLLCADLKGEVQKLLPAATAIELIHCASLIHDDLPAIDDDDMRRGKLSCHKQFSEATAVLAGDVMVPLATKIVLESEFSAELKVAMAHVLTTGFVELCCGQQLDILPAADRGELETVHQLKTGSLFKVACQFGALGANKDPKSFAVLGVQLGTLFQFIDDMLDVFGENEAKGRDVSSDIKNEKETLATTGNREIFERRLKNLKTSIEATLKDLTESYPASNSFPKVRFLLEELFSRAESI